MRKLLLPLLLCSLLGCSQGGSPDSPVFTALVGAGQGQFRGHSLGQPLAQVQSTEEALPRIQDDSGLVYDLHLPDGVEAVLEYYADPSDSTHLLAGMVANISLPGEVEASQLYRSLQSWLDARYEVPDGGLGYFTWRSAEHDTEVVLRLMDSKTAISLNYYRPTDKLSLP